jgi:hypothetical protein
MLAHEFKRSQYDGCVYIKCFNESPIYLMLYVDMFIAAKSKKVLGFEAEKKNIYTHSP